MVQTTVSSRKIAAWHIILGIFLLCLFLFLSIRASDEYRWSDWGFGDAQTMLSLRQWEEEGWSANYFLFIPQGYAKVIKFFDEPGFRQHAHGTCPGSSPRIGPRLWYTHYPAGYLIPYAALFRIGLDDIFHVRMLSILFSLGSLILMYIVFSEITSSGVSFVAVIFYGLSPAFLGYADSIANQPIDDLLRFAFMLAIILSTRASALRHRQIWMAAAWAFEFMLSLASFDSVFFIYLWLIGWDILDKQGFRWKRYLIYGLAPLLAHSLQFLQNVWYLGFNDAVIDIKDAFILKTGTDTTYNLGHGWLTTMQYSIGILFNNLYVPGSFIGILVIFYLLYAWLLKDKQDAGLPSIRLLAILFLCGMAFVLILPHAARMPYEARQMLPFASLLISGVVWSSAKMLKDSIHGNPHTQEGLEPQAPESLLRRSLKLLYLFLSAILILIFWYQFTLNERKPIYFIPNEKTDAQYAREIETMQRYDLMKFRQIRDEVLFAKEIKKLPTVYEPVFFNINGFRLFWDPAYVPGYPQIMPITEYYAGSRPILCFDTPEGIVADLIYLARRSPYKFSPVLVAGNPGHINYILSLLLKEGALKGAPPGISSVMDRYVLDLTGYLK